MRKTIGFPSLLLALTVAASAQQPTAKPAAKAAHAEAAAMAQLPVTRVSLYKNGVGFFEHTGRVTGDQAVTIDFTTAQLNDVLQSLTAIDLGGGRIAGAGYNSTTPLEQQLKALPLALGEDPTAVDFYNAIRGARVEVRAPGATISGRLLNIEVINTPQGDNKPSVETRQITVIAEGGEIRTVSLTAATEVRLLDADLHRDVTRYLQLLAGTRNQGLRHMTLQDNGTGVRELRVSYISEVPIWKSTYRILFSEPKAGSATAPQTATLQGWSVVDNTTGADWINVHLSLIAGAPQSFIQPLSVPYYSRRPEIGLPQEAQLAPQTHESGETVTNAPVPLSGATRIGNGRGSGGGIGTGSASGVAGGTFTTSGASGIYGGSGATGLNDNYVNGAPVSNVVQQGNQRNPTNFQYLMPGTEQAENSFGGNTQTAKFDDYFAYNLTEPITIRKNESAMVPILQTKIDAERVTLWSARQPTPLRALWITNTSKLTLDRGSFSIVEDGNFGGEGLLDPIHPDEKRLLSYAVDQAVRVSTDYSNSTHRIERITASKGVLHQTTLDISEVEYLVHNAATEPRTVVIEQPVQAGWTIDSDPKPVETTATANRFRVEVQAGETVRLHIGERHSGISTFYLTRSDDNQLLYIINQSGNDAAVRQALQPVLDARRRVAEAQSAVDQVNDHMKALRSDEDRQRANITALGNADKVSRGRFVHDLNATEDQIAGAQKDLTAAQARLQSAKDDLANKIETLQIDEKL
ncbi:MAG: hypothetical protein P4K80_06285 [Acidobacteriaceae bacterium]|nr:hypothetical protein [Acidobacteriaceae bacterium]